MTYKKGQVRKALGCLGGDASAGSDGAATAAAGAAVLLLAGATPRPSIPPRCTRPLTRHSCCLHARMREIKVPIVAISVSQPLDSLLHHAKRNSCSQARMREIKEPKAKKQRAEAPGRRDLSHGWHGRR